MTTKFMGVQLAFESHSSIIHERIGTSEEQWANGAFSSMAFQYATSTIFFTSVMVKLSFGHGKPAFRSAREHWMA